MPSTYEVTHSADVPHREGEVQLVSQKPGTSIEPQALTRLLGVLNLDYSMDWLDSSSSSDLTFEYRRYFREWWRSPGLIVKRVSTAFEQHLLYPGLHPIDQLCVHHAPLSISREVLSTRCFPGRLLASCLYARRAW
jgi:hypothetical protein